MRRWLPQWLPYPYLVAFALAVVVRLLAARSTGPIESPDSGGYLVGARAIASYLFSNDPTLLSRPPGYPIFLAIFSSTAWSAGVQIVLSAATAVLLGVTAERHYGRIAGWAAAALGVVSPAFTQWTPYILSDTLALAVFAAALERTTAPASRRSGFVGGLLTASSVLVRPAYGISAAVISLAFLMRHRSARVIVVLFLVGLVLVPAAFAARNVVATGRFMLYESRGWETFWQGTQWNERGRGTGGIDIFYPPEIELLNRSERQIYFRDTGLAFVREHPLDFIGLAARKGYWYMLTYYPEWSLAHKLASGGFGYLLYALAAVGAAATRRHWMTRLLVLTAAGFLVTAMLTIVDYDARYRIPFELTLIPLAGAGCAWLADRLSRESRTVPGPSASQ